MKKITSENDLWSASPNDDSTAWAISDGIKIVGIFRAGGFKSLYPLSVSDMLIVIALMLRVHLYEQNEEEVLKTKNKENG